MKITCKPFARGWAIVAVTASLACGLTASFPALAQTQQKQKATQAAGKEARFAKCRAFLKRHGLTCDPRKEPTCGARTGFVRPAECFDD